MESGVATIPSVNIMGTRGIPAAHGGFETFAECLALYLVERGWQVTVYGQGEGAAPTLETPMREPIVDRWHGIERRIFTPRRAGALGTIEFDRACVRDVIGRPGVDLVLGYNTAVLNLAQRLRGRRVVMNMDGIEWKRQKWSLPARAWLFANELIGLNTSTTVIADHPEIARQLSRRGIREPVMIPYGATVIEAASAGPLAALDLSADGYYLGVCRLEPENSVLEIVRAYNAASRAAKLVLLGRLDPGSAYHRALAQAAGDAVVFPGAIYDAAVVASLRFHARAYLHGHQVGGTNPSLVEALGAGNAVIAHDNKYNRWTAGDGQFFFADQSALATMFDRLEHDDGALVAARQAARIRFDRDFRWEDVLGSYERCLLAAGHATT